MTQDWDTARPDRRGRVLAAVAVTVVLALLLAGRITQAGDPAELTVEETERPLPAPTATQTPEPRDVSPRPVGSWRSLADAPLRPIAPRTGHLAVWTGTEMLVWGGLTDGRWRTDGAAYDPARDTWRRVPDWWDDLDPPTTAVWTGDEMVVLGRHAAAAYQPQADRWRWLPTPPRGDWAWAAAGWAAGLLVVIAHDTRRAIGYEPAQDVWHDLLPPPVLGWEGSASVAADGDLVVSGLRDNSVAFTRWITAEWAWEPAAVPPADEWWIPWLTAAGGDVLVAGHAGAWRWTGTDWIGMPALPAPLLRGERLTLAWTGDGMLAWAGDSPSNGVVLVDGEWRQVRPAPVDIRRGSSAVWTGAELLVWGAHGGAALRVGGGGWAHAPPPPDVPLLDGQWRELAPPPFARDSPTLTWTGTALLVWGGAEGRPVSTGAAYDPVADTWRLMAEAPLHGRLLHQTVWTGTELLVWGGTTISNAIDDGAAYDPTTDTWRRLPDAPIAQAGATRAVWTGTEMVVVTGPADKVAAAYDPVADRWRRLPDLPRTGHLVGVVWTGAEVVTVFDALEGSVLRFDGDGWATGADLGAPRPSSGMEVGWTGREIVVWGGADDSARPGGFAYDPTADTWRTLPQPWFAGSYQPSGIPWTGTHLLVSGVARDGRGLGAYAPDSDRWYALPTPPAGPLLDGPMVWTGDELVVWSMHGPPLVFRPTQ